MQAAPPTAHPSDPRVQQHFDRSASLYVDHTLAVYRNSVDQRLDLLLSSSNVSPEDEFSVLDIGCGGGAFLDRLLERFPNACGTGVDISESMLRSNRPSPRKTLLQADALALTEQLGSFDVICVDTVMHHLISRRGYPATQKRILHFLESLHRLLRPGGRVLIREIYHEYRLMSSLGSRIIFALTTLTVPRQAAIVLRTAGLQTANVGVCFQTRPQWQQLFSSAGFAVSAMEDRRWPGQPYRKFGFAQSGDLHFVLKPSRPQL